MAPHKCHAHFSEEMYLAVDLREKLRVLANLCHRSWYFRSHFGELPPTQNAQLLHIYAERSKNGPEMQELFILYLTFKDFLRSKVNQFCSIFSFYYFDVVAYISVQKAQ